MIDTCPLKKTRILWSLSYGFITINCYHLGTTTGWSGIFRDDFVWTCIYVFMYVFSKIRANGLSDRDQIFSHIWYRQAADPVTFWRKPVRGQRYRGKEKSNRCTHMPPPLVGIKRCFCLTSGVCLTSDVSLSRTSGLSREQRGIGRPKLAEVAHVTRDSGTTFKVKRSRSPGRFTQRGKKIIDQHNISKIIIWYRSVYNQTASDAWRYNKCQ